ncbi:MAG: hypothetical protein M3R35_01410 [Candidatus Eremiobacteraeota bacterium]|nr:hypothetical protein [Candidatus Eremiobacteraeota bacterium]
MLAIVAVAAAYANRDRLRIKIASVYVKVPPKLSAAETPPPLTGGGHAFGDAPWALSALPECLSQISITHGGRAYVLRHLPTGMTPVQPSTRLTYADCVITVGSSDARVTRRGDRFHIPADVQFFVKPGALSLLRTEGRFAELRTYAPSKSQIP